MAKLQIEENYPLASLTTFNVGGPARYYAAIESEAALLEALSFAKSGEIPIFMLGGGSNILVSDAGFDGLVIHNRIKGGAVREEGGYCCVYAGSGEDWQEFVDRCVLDDLQGVECLAGIPGTVGASPVQNIGAYGQEVSRTIVEVRALEAVTGKHVVFGNEACEFGYRASIFNSSSEGRYFITGVAFRLKRNGKPCVTHRELSNRLEKICDFTVRDVRDCVLDIRAAKGLLARKGFECFQCAGSFFKNPVLPAAAAREIAAKKAEVATWPVGSDEVKISAAGLIQAAGFERGYRKGNVGLSPKHALIIIAHSGAAAAEVVALAKEVRRKVKEKFNVFLTPEVRLIGFPSSCLE